MLEALEEAITIGRNAGVRVQISHHKACGRKSWGSVKDSLAMIDEAQSQGVDVWADQYPYVATSTGLGAMFPKWVHDGGRSALLARLTNPEIRARLREELIRETEGGWIGDFGGWESVVISHVREEQNLPFEGLSITEIAQITGKHPVDQAIDLMVEERGSVGMMHFVIDERDVVTVMRHPRVVIGSDATARTRVGPLSKGKPHPRAYGTFARVLGKYVREDGILTLEEAVAKMTSRSAARLSLPRRGVLAEGYFADITVFDPQKIADTATFKDAHSHAAGIQYVLVNGQVVVDQGNLIGVDECSPGRVLRRGERGG